MEPNSPMAAAVPMGMSSSGIGMTLPELSIQARYIGRKVQNLNMTGQKDGGESRENTTSKLSHAIYTRDEAPNTARDYSQDLGGSKHSPNTKNKLKKLQSSKNYKRVNLIGKQAVYNQNQKTSKYRKYDQLTATMGGSTLVPDTIETIISRETD